MAELWIQLECGRRGAGSIDCLVCGEKIHERVDGSGEWWDGEGSTKGVLGPQASPTSLTFHDHTPAKETGPTLGPFEFQYVQITYDTLRYEGETIASFDRERGDWIIEDPWTGAGEAYSDIVISVRED